MPQTRIDIEQAQFLGGSGTFTAGEELSDASGVLQNNIDNVANSIPSGLDDFDDVGSVLNFPFQRLALLGDDNDGTPQTVQGFAALRFSRNGSNFVEWSVRAPAGGASGLTLQIGWTPSNTDNGSVQWQLSLNTLGSGVDLASVTPDVETLDLAGPSHGGDWVEDRMYIHNIAVSGFLEPLQITNLKLQYLGGPSTINRNVYLLNSAVKFSVE